MGKIKRKTTDFADVLTKLHKWGINDYQMAEITGLDRSKYTKLRTGARSQVNYDDGVMIMEIFNAEKEKRTK